MSHLTDDELGWINCYEVGDTVFFRSDSLSIDTLIVEDKFVIDRRNPFYIHFVDNYKGSKYQAYAGYDYKIKRSGMSIDGDLMVHKLIENDSIKFGVRLFGRRSNEWPNEWDSSKDRKIYKGENPIKVVSFALDGRKFDNCIVLAGDNSYTLPRWEHKTPRIESFVISKDYGLICYKFEGGEEFHRVFD